MTKQLSFFEPKMNIGLNLPSSLESSVLANAPSLDEDVRLQLRKLGEPVTYFGEDKADRRARLIKLLTRIENEKLLQDSLSQANDITIQDGGGTEGETQDDEMEDDEDEEFWTPGPEDLVDIRLKLSNYSIKKAKKRIIRQQNEAHAELIDTLKYRRLVNKEISKFDLVGSNLMSTRAVSVSRFSPSGSKIATGSWFGDLKILDIETLEPDESISAPVKKYPAQVHNKLTGLDWHPKADIRNSSKTLNLVSANSNNNSIQLWSLDKQEPLCSLSGHEGRIANTKFHPCGDYIASSSYDKTWRFWDIEKQQELYLQEGHSKEVHALSFQKDGALLASGGLDAIGNIWDLRTGKVIMSLLGHIKEIMAIDWSDNGYQVATGSKDCSIKIWDLRYTSNKANNTGYNEYIYNDSPLFTIPAHTKLISDLTFFHSGSSMAKYLNANDSRIDGSSSFLLSSSYDGTLKIWSADNWIKVKTLKGHTDNKIMSCDISPIGDKIVSSGWDRSVKLWSNLDFF